MFSGRFVSHCEGSDVARIAAPWALFALNCIAHLAHLAGAIPKDLIFKAHRLSET